MNDNDIGFIIWGTKGGFRVFCGYKVDYSNDRSIAGTIRDAREFVRFNKAKVNYYALEFTHDYKVYTIYRSAYEVVGSSGAFVAITVYIPHNRKIPDILLLLNRMMDAYFDCHVDPQSMCIKGERENINFFIDILNATTSVPDVPRKWVTSPQNNRFPIIVYNTDEELKSLLATPYRREYIEYQEIVFMSREIHDHMDDYRGIFTVPPQKLNINDLKNEERPLKISPFSSPSVNIVYFSKNGQDITASYTDEPFYENDKISLRLEKTNCQPSESGEMTIAQAIQSGLFSRVDTTLSLNVNGINFKSKQFIIQVSNSGNIKKLDNVVFLASNQIQIPCVNNTFTLNSEQINQEYTVYYNYNDMSHPPVFGNYLLSENSFIDLQFDVIYYKIRSGLEDTPISIRGTDWTFKSTSEVFLYISIAGQLPTISAQGIEVTTEKDGNVIYLKKKEKKQEKTLPVKNSTQTPNSCFEYKFILRHSQDTFDDGRFSLWIDDCKWTNKGNEIIVASERTLQGKEATICDEDQVFKEEKIRIVYVSNNPDPMVIELRENTHKRKWYRNCICYLKDKKSYVIVSLVGLVGIGILLFSIGVLPLKKSSTKCNPNTVSASGGNPGNEQKEVAQDVSDKNKKEQKNDVLVGEIQAAWSKLDLMSCCRADVKHLDALIKADSISPPEMKEIIMEHDTVDCRKEYTMEDIEERIKKYEDFFYRLQDAPLSIAKTTDGLSARSFLRDAIEKYSCCFSKEQVNLFVVMIDLANTQNLQYWKKVDLFNMSKGNYENPSFNDVNEKFK